MVASLNPKGPSTQMVDDLGPNGFPYRYFGPRVSATSRFLGPWGLKGYVLELEHHGVGFGAGIEYSVYQGSKYLKTM